MKTWVVVTVCTLLSLGSASFARAGEKAPSQVIALARTALVKLGTDPVIVKAVKAENAKGKSLEHIKAMDERWRKTPGIADLRAGW